MKPHPKLRKTIKWGGAAVTVLLLVVWIGSGWCVYGRFIGNMHFAMLVHGRVVATRTSWDMRDLLEPVMRDGNGPVPFRLDWAAALKGKDRTTDWQIVLPFGALALVPGLATVAAWRLDTRARRRERIARLNLCPTCNYNRTGLALSAVCPECGSPPASAS